MRNLEKKGALEEAAGSTLNKNLFIYELDVSKEDSITKFLTETYAREERIDVLINNAGISHHGHFETVTLQQMQSVFQTNVFGPLVLTQGVFRKMKEQKSGHIIFLSSILGIMPMPLLDFYVGTKYALEGIASSLSPVLMHYNIHLTIVEPGPVLTRMSTPLSEIIQRKSKTSGVRSADVDADVDLATVLVENNLKNMYKRLQNYAQTGQDVAEVIKECICIDNPPVRIQTSAAMIEKAKGILIDPTGRKMDEEAAKMLK